MSALSKLTRNQRIALAVFAIGAVILYFILREQYAYGFQSPDRFILRQLGSNLVAAAIGLAIGFLPILVITRYWPYALAVGGLVYLGLVLTPGVGTGMTAATGIIAAIGGLILGLRLVTKNLGDLLPDTFGTSRWATKEDLETAELTGQSGFSLGRWIGKDGNVIPLRYNGKRHLLTVAPTRAGKGTSAIIPNLLTHPGSALVIDPKGENALITAAARQRLGQHICVVDPWNLAADKLSLPQARFNPLDWLVPGDPDLSENAMLLADALIVPRQTNDPFWDDEARALIYGFLLHIATDPDEQQDRTLGRLRDILTLPTQPASNSDNELEGTIEGVLAHMLASDVPQVRASAGRILQKPDKERASVMSNAQSQTHFLESPRLREALSVSDFSFETLKTGALTVYLILPADRLSTFDRWLRLMIQQAITQTARNIALQPRYQVLFMLDEMAALGHLKMVEQAYGLMAGFGMQLWGIVQDLSQLERIYGKGWETFVGNSGVLQYFGSRDQMTAEYFSKLCGVTTVWNISTAFSTAAGGSSSNSENKAPAQRSLAYADELMTLHHDRELLLVENAYPIQGFKLPWFEDPELKKRGVNLHAAPAPAPKGPSPTPSQSTRA